MRFALLSGKHYFPSPVELEESKGKGNDDSVRNYVLYLTVEPKDHRIAQDLSNYKIISFSSQIGI